MKLTDAATELGIGHEEALLLLRANRLRVGPAAGAGTTVTDRSVAEVRDFLRGNDSLAVYVRRRAGLPRSRVR